MIILDAAFAHPRGLLGYLGGVIMARSTGERNAWTLSLLDLRPEDQPAIAPNHRSESRTAPRGAVAGSANH
jgi:hypothetical protein